MLRDVLLPRSCEITHKTPANIKPRFLWAAQSPAPLELAVKQDQKHDSFGPRPTRGHGTFPLLKTQDQKAVAVSHRLTGLFKNGENILPLLIYFP